MREVAERAATAVVGVGGKGGSSVRRAMGVGEWSVCSPSRGVASGRGGEAGGLPCGGFRVERGRGEVGGGGRACDEASTRVPSSWRGR